MSKSQTVILTNHFNASNTLDELFDGKCVCYLPEQLIIPKFAMVKLVEITANANISGAMSLEILDFPNKAYIGRPEGQGESLGGFIGLINALRIAGRDIVDYPYLSLKNEQEMTFGSLTFQFRYLGGLPFAFANNVILGIQLHIIQDPNILKQEKLREEHEFLKGALLELIESKIETIQKLNSLKYNIK